MFPNPNTFSKVSGRLLAEACWAPFVPSSLIESERATYLASVLANKATSTSDVNEFRESHTKLLNNFEALDRHVRRSPRLELKDYLKDVKTVIERHYKEPCYATWTILEEHCGKHVPRLLKDLQDGAYSSALIENIHESLVQKIASEAVFNVLTLSRSNTFTEATTDHNSFLRSFEKEFRVEIHHWEPVAEGLLVHLSQEAHDVLSESLHNPSSILTRVTSKYGYVLLKEGNQEEIDFGAFPEPTSKWLFIRC